MNSDKWSSGRTENSDLYKKLEEIKASRNASRGGKAAKAASYASSQEAKSSSSETQTSVDRQKVIEGAKKNKVVRNFIIGTITLSSVLLAAGLVVPGITKDKNKTPQSTPQTIETVSESESYNPYVGETAMGTKYDYSHYADYDHKETPQSFDYDVSACFGNREEATEKLMEIANRTPEALSSYAWSIFTAEEKLELGIYGMSMTEIDDYMSSETNPDAGAMQGRLLSKLEEVLKSDTTYFDFYYENDSEYSTYIDFVDKNNDGKMTPNEMNLDYSLRVRKNAPQLGIWRCGEKDINDKNNWYKAVDLNLRCGDQVNFELANPTQAHDTATVIIPSGTPVTYETPTETPYEIVPPVIPPAENPPAENPPAENPPAENPPAENPPAENPPAENPPAENPPAENPPAENPPAENPPAENPPAENPPETPAPKNYENMERIDNQILDNIAQDIGTGEVKVTPTPTEVVEQQAPTAKPAPEAYEGTAPTIVENQEASGAAQVQSQVELPENNYVENLGGANAEEYSPVPEAPANQAAADAGERTPDNTLHAEDAGNFSVDDLLAQP